MKTQALLPLLTLPLALTLLSAPAGAQVVDPQAPPSEPTARAGSGWFGGQVLAADLLGVAAGVGVSRAVDSAYPLVLTWALAAPAVHLAHGDPGGAAGSLLLHLAAPVAGAVIGYGIDSAHCGPDEWFCGIGGLALGGLVGMIVATTVDAAFLSNTPRDERLAHRTHRTHALAVPTVAVNPNGGFVLGLAARL